MGLTKTEKRLKEIAKEKKQIMEEIKESSEFWVETVTSMNEAAWTDRVLEKVVENSKKLEKLHEEYFSLIG